MARGAELLGWLDTAGQRHAISPTSLNAYLSMAGAGAFTAKTLRTRTGTTAAFEAAAQMDRLSIAAVARAASERLHNTPSIAKSKTPERSWPIS